MGLRKKRVEPRRSILDPPKTKGWMLKYHEILVAQSTSSGLVDTTADR